MLLLSVDAAEIFKWIGYIIVAMLCFMFMIVVHELGHYTAGKLLGFKINEFAVGFGPAIFKKTKKNGEVFSLRCIPAGGFCAFEGEDEEEGERPDAFNAKPVWKRIIVLAAGVTFNFVSAIVHPQLFLHGLTARLYRTSAAVYEYTDGAEQQFQEGDLILSVRRDEDVLHDRPEQARVLVRGGGAHEVVVLRDGEEVTLTVEKHTYDQVVTDELGRRGRHAGDGAWDILYAVAVQAELRRGAGQEFHLFRAKWSS